MATGADEPAAGRPDEAPPSRVAKVPAAVAGFLVALGVVRTVMPDEWKALLLILAAAGAVLGARPGPAWRRGAGAGMLLVPPLALLFVAGHAERLAGPPSSAATQAAALLASGGVLAVLLVHWLRADAWPAGTGPRAGAALLTAALAAGFLAAGLGSPAPGASPAGASAYDVAPDIVQEVRMRDYRFLPQDPVLPAGRLVEFVLVNEDADLHTFTYDLGGRHHDHEVPGGATLRFLARFDEPGLVHYYCEPHHAANMLGNMQIVAA